MAAVGLLIGAVPAGALPPLPLEPVDCASYQFPGGRVSLNYPVLKAQTEFDTVAGGTRVDTVATTRYPESSMSGTVVGGIDGKNIRLEVTRKGTSRTYSPLVLTGQVGSDNRGHGTYTFEQGSGSWDTIEPLKCVPAPPPPPPPAPVQPKPVAVEQPAPAPQEAAPEQVPAPEQAPADAPANDPGQLCIPDPFDLNFPGAC